MVISSLGHFCFKLKGKRVTVVTDPYDQTASGKLMPKLRADIVTLSSDTHRDVSRIVDSSFIIKGPGEYEIKGVSIFGISLGENTAYVYGIDDLTLCHLVNSTWELTDKQTEELGEIDILLVPDNKRAVAIIERLEPKIVIPMNSSGEILGEIGKEKVKPVKRLRVVPSSLPEEREVVWLKK